MPQARVGFRRVYEALGCGTSSGASLSFEGIVGGVSVQIYLGPEPVNGVGKLRSDAYLIPGRLAKTVPVEADWNFFCELSGSVIVEVPDDTWVAAKAHDPKAWDIVLEMAQSVRPNVSAALDVVAGTMGLRVHWQFVASLVDEVTFAWLDDFPLSQKAFPAWRVLEGPSLNDSGAAMIRSLMSNWRGDEEPLAWAADVLSWLLRAWTQHDPLTRFVDLFVPLEMVINRCSPQAPSPNRSEYRLIRKLLRASSDPGGPNALAAFNRLAEHSGPPLEQRFAAMARAGSLAGWEGDIEAFGAFNKARNDLVHRGSRNATLHAEVSDSSVQELEDLTERYVSWALFGDTMVYQSQFRRSHAGGTKFK